MVRHRRGGLRRNGRVETVAADRADAVAAAEPGRGAHMHRRWLTLSAAIGTAAVILGVSGQLTDLSSWYTGLRMPPWKPPDWLFGPMWTLIFSLWVVAVDFAWRHAASSTDRIFLVVCLGLNGVLNILWSGLFFHLHHPDWALIEVGFLWLSIPLAMYALWRISRRIAWLLAPYLGWVSMAALLNLAIVRLNYGLALGGVRTVAFGPG